jgi:predicted nuclease of predicted toxin-antitoxin system
VKFLVDMPLSKALVRWLTSQGHDTVHAAEVGLHRAPDTELVRYARSTARTIITADLDYPRLLALAHAAEPSLILFRGGNWSEADVIDRISAVLDVVKERELQQSILVIERDRVRRRRSPIEK